MRDKFEGGVMGSDGCIYCIPLCLADCAMSEAVGVWIVPCAVDGFGNTEQTRALRSMRRSMGSYQVFATSGPWFETTAAL